MNKNSLLYKIITSFATILAIILVASSIFLTFAYKGTLNKENLELLERECKVLTDTVVSEQDVQSENEKSYSIQEKLDDFKAISNVDVLICDNNGFIYSKSGSIEGLDDVNKINISDEYLQELQKGNVIEYGEVENNKEYIDAYISPIFNGDKQYGIIVMISSQNYISQSLFSGYKIIWISTLVALALAIICINYFTKKQLINPLKEIYLVANRLARGEVDNRIEVKSSDEIGELAKSFNLMAESLEAVDMNRRDFISNVSHELRSPITSMKGFIAGMLDGVIPKDKENYYLKLVYDEINRLSRLVNDLLDISSMEVGKFKLTIMEVDINALVKRCLLNIESKVNNKGIRINATLENEHLFVYADSDRIMQVLTNLLDNAIKYGSEDGIIDVSTRIKGPKVHVSVYNNGSKMTEEEMAHIWDRFYKSDKSRTHKESTGLGLPIVRLIMTQHKEDVWVRNEREGVVFTFTLAKV